MPQKNTELVPQPPGDNPAHRSSCDVGRSPLAQRRRARPRRWPAAVGELLRRDRQKIAVFFKIDDDANYGRAVKVDICKGAGAATAPGIITKD